MTDQAQDVAQARRVAEAREAAREARDAAREAREVAKEGSCISITLLVLDWMHYSFDFLFFFSAFFFSSSS